MRLISCLNGKREQLAVVVNDEAYTLCSLHPLLPETMGVFLKNWDVNISATQHWIDKLMANPDKTFQGIPMRAVELLAPVPKPRSLRDGYAFRQHVETARRNRGLAMTTAFDEYPVFYFGNHKTVTGPGEISCMPDHFEKLDFELEVAILMAKKGKNIRAEQADEFIGGLMIMNDFSARTLQMEEMLLNLGPAKGKDFATTAGPWLVTTDELKSFEVPCKKNHTGRAWNMTMSAFLNGEKISEGNLSDMDWTFAEIIERASYGVDLYPGDVIGSGTVGTGCLLELNGSGKLQDPDYPERWLRPGDEITLTVEGLGSLVNTVIRDASDYSILNQKKNQHIL